MRFERLDLLRFGRFTDRSLAMPAVTPDLHIVFGPNETGKTTTMHAVEDFLFGIPIQSPYAFLHSYGDLRVGAVMASGDERFEFRRRKGNKDTLIDPGGMPIPTAEAALARLLGGAGRGFFLRMFSLSHERLAEGGKEIVAADGEVGETLFSAGSGLRGLRERRKQLDDEASSIFQKRKAATRVFYRAADRLAAATKSLRETIRKPDEWKSLKTQLDRAQAERRRLDEKYGRIAAEAKKVGRIRRILPAVRQETRLDQEIATLGEVVLLPKDAGEQARKAAEDAGIAEAEIRVHERDLRDKQRQRDAVLVDDPTYERRTAFLELEKTRVNVLQMREHLPKRQGELEAALEEVRSAAVGLDWKFSDDASLLKRIPSRRAVAALTGLQQKRGALEEARKAREDSLHAAERRLEEQQSRLSDAPHPGDAPRLAAVLAAHRGSADLDARLRDGQRDLDEVCERISVLRASLRPSLPDEVLSESDLRGLPGPHLEVIGGYRDRVRGLEEELREVRRTFAEQRRLLRSDQEKRRRDAQKASGITFADLEKVRAERDDLWRLLRRRYQDQETVPADLDTQYETSIRRADCVADDRFLRAEAAGRLAELDEAIQGREADLEEAAAAEARLAGDGERLLAEWRSLWTGCAFEPGSPAEMVSWRQTLGDLTEAVRSEGRNERALAALSDEADRARADLTAVLTGFGVSAGDLAAESLGVLIRRAEEVQRKEKDAAQREQEARTALLKAREECARERERLHAAVQEWSGWEAEWRQAIEKAGLDSASSGSGTAAAELLAEMRDAAGRAQEIQTKRIDRMHRDIRAFEVRVSELVSEIAPDLEGMAPEEAVLRFSARLETDLDQRRQRGELTKAIAQIEGRIRDRRNALAESEGTLTPLYHAAGVRDLAALRAAIGRSNRYRELTRDRETVLRGLEEVGDGFAFDELREECAGVNPDEAREREQAVEVHRLELEQERNRAVEQVVNLRRELDAFQDDDAAARLEAERQEAMAAMRDAAERYARVRTAEMLLRWALERFRKEKQGPMLRRAGDLFRTLTLGSFTSLQVDFDSRDRMRLDAVRADSEEVQVAGLSSGSEDQLYLALRVAAVEDYVSKASSLPFIADDLFINFDEERAAAGFRVLAELAKRTQVLFFTHHEHLLGIAREVLGEGLPVIRLEDV